MRSSWRINGHHNGDYLQIAVVARSLQDALTVIYEKWPHFKVDTSYSCLNDVDTSHIVMFRVN